MCSSAFPDDDRQIGSLSMENLDPKHRPVRKIVGYERKTRAMNVSLLQYKRDDTVVVVEPWLTMSTLLFKALNYAGNLRAPIHVTDGSVLFLFHPKHYSCRSEF